MFIQFLAGLAVLISLSYALQLQRHPVARSLKGLAWAMVAFACATVVAVVDPSAIALSPWACLAGWAIGQALLEAARRAWYVALRRRVRED